MEKRKRGEEVGGSGFWGGEQSEPVSEVGPLELSSEPMPGQARPGQARPAMDFFFLTEESQAQSTSTVSHAPLTGCIRHPMHLTGR